ncbi:MAG: carboxypeptidase regulatory-like domain-containing protein [Vicinamibacterales bacterium]
MTAAAEAQTSLATVRGTVHDEQTAVLPGVTVTARQTATNTTRSTASNESGQYFIPNLPPGEYELTVELSGFTTLKRAVDLRVGQELTIDFALRVGGVLEAVTVKADSRVVATQHTVATVIDTKQIDDLPTISRDFSSLAKLAPGTTASGATGTGQGTGVSIGGQRPTANGIVVDGASNQMQFYGRQANEFPQDWIQEFQVLTNGFGAEYGQAAGGLLNVITRSGANAFKGRGYGFFRDDAFDKPPYAGRFVNGEPVYLADTPPFSQQRLGGFLGGPVRKDQLFFFTGVDRQNLDSSVVLGISDYWRAQGVETVLPTGTDSMNYIAKADWNIGASQRFSGRYSNTDRQDKNVSLSASPLDTEETRYTFGGPLWNVVGNLASTLGSSTFNEARVFYGVNQPFINSNLADAGGAALLAKAGLGGQTGLFSQKTYPGANFGPAGFTGLEGESNLFLIDNFSHVRGRHQFKVGAQLARQTMFMDVEASHKGRWGFTQDLVFDRNNPATWPDTFSGTIGTGVATLTAWNPGVFAQDTWQATSGLTLNLGLRYDVDRSPATVNQFVDPYNARIVARLGGTAPLQKSKVDTNNVAPRLGFVWTPTAAKNTAIRGSFGLFYDQNHYNYTDIYLNETLLSERRLTLSANDPGTNPFWNAADPVGSRAAARAFLVQSYPAYPNLSQLRFSTETILGVAPDFKIPYSAQSSIGATHHLGALTLQADFAYSRTDDAASSPDINWALTNGAYVRADPRYSRISLVQNNGWIRYRALLTRAEYRAGDRGRVGVSYTVAKTRSNTSTGLGTGGNTNPFDLGEDEGPDDNDRRHNFVMDGSYLLPFQIQAAGIWVYRSALPYSVSTTFQLDADPFTDRPEPRNARRGDSEKNVDARLSKIFKFGRYSVTGFYEVYNLLNTDNFLRYQGSMQSSSFGLPLTELEKRRQQLGFRFDF